MGLPSPWLQNTSSIGRIIYSINDVQLLFNSVYLLWAYLYTISTGNVPFQEVCALGIGSASFICGIILTIYHPLHQQRLKRLTDNIDTVSRKIMDGELGQEEQYLQIYEDNAKRIPTFLIYLPFCTMTLYSLPVPLIDWLYGAYRTHHPLPLQSPFDDKQPGVYELLVFLEVTSVCANSKKNATECLFMSLFKSYTTILRYLSVVMEDMKQEFLKNGLDSGGQKKLADWVLLHQDVIRNVQDLLSIISPVVILNYLNILCVVVCGLFVQIKKDDTNIAQSMGMGFFVMIIVSQYFILANTAEELIMEAQKLASVVYDIPWYNMKKSKAVAVKTVIAMSNRPIQITAYNTVLFQVNKETFGGFLVSSLSAFVTLCQMKDVFDKK